MCRFDLAWCIKAKWGEQVPSVVDMICSPGSIEIPRKTIKRHNPWVWKLPELGHLKVNVDGFFLERSAREGIRGVVRDSEGKVPL